MLLRRLVGPFVVLVLLGSGVAVAAIPDSDGVIEACYSDRTGAVRVIDSEAGQSCDRREVALSWNQQGPQGEPGIPGQDGAEGADGQDGEDGLDGQDGTPGPGLAAIEDLAGVPCRVGHPDEGVVVVDLAPATGTTRPITFGCRSTELDTLTVNKTGSGTVSGGPISCGTTCSTELARGAEVELTATAATGWVFDGWSGACTGTGACQVVMDGDQAVTAQFTKLVELTLILTADSNTFGLDAQVTMALEGALWNPGTDCRVNSASRPSTTCRATVRVGTPLTIRATALAGAIGWGGLCTGSPAFHCTLPMNDHTGVVAHVQR